MMLYCWTCAQPAAFWGWLSLPLETHGMIIVAVCVGEANDETSKLVSLFQAWQDIVGL